MQFYFIRFDKIVFSSAAIAYQPSELSSKMPLSGRIHWIISVHRLVLVLFFRWQDPMNNKRSIYARVRQWRTKVYPHFWNKNAWNDIFWKSLFLSKNCYYNPQHWITGKAGLPEPPIFESFGSGSSSGLIPAPAPSPPHKSGKGGTCLLIETFS